MSCWRREAPCSACCSSLFCTALLLLCQALPAARALLCRQEPCEGDGAGDHYPTSSGFKTILTAPKPPLLIHVCLPPGSLWSKQHAQVAVGPGDRHQGPKVMQVSKGGKTSPVFLLKFVEKTLLLLKAYCAGGPFHSSYG